MMRRLRAFVAAVLAAVGLAALAPANANAAPTTTEVVQQSSSLADWWL